MKNYINHYYNLEVKDIHYIKNKYFFGNYVLNPYERDLNEIDTLYTISLNLNRMGIYTHQIIPNIDKKFVTIINDKPYVLMIICDKLDKKITIDDIVNFENIKLDLSKYKNIQRENWKELWSNKIDYFEYQVNQFGKKYSLIKESFSYYVGIAETGINLLNAINNVPNINLSHNRINFNSTLYDLYNPLNYVIDSKVRDASEYFKNTFLQEENIYEKITNYIEKNNLSENELLLFYIRMFYPSFYFDLYEKIIENNADENIINKAIKKTNQYEDLLKNLYLYFSKYINLPNIEWLKIK